MRVLTWQISTRRRPRSTSSLAMIILPILDSMGDGMRARMNLSKIRRLFMFMVASRAAGPLFSAQRMSMVTKSLLNLL